MRSAPLSQTEAFHINDTGEDHPPIHRSESQTERECCAKPNAKEHFEQVLGKCICPCHTQRSDWRERFDQLAKKLRLREETVSGVDEYGLVLNFVSAERENVRRELIELVKELGHQQEDDAIWVNMDEFLTRLKNE
jgi:hypothetical protein